MSTHTAQTGSIKAGDAPQMNGAPRMKQSLFDLLRADGFTFVGARDPQALIVGRSPYPTFVKNGVSVALQQSRGLLEKAGDAVIYESGATDVIVWGVVTQPQLRRAGRARRAMAGLIAKADAAGVTLFIDAAPLQAGAMSREQLSDFYQSLGFTSNDQATRVMRREPA